MPRRPRGPARGQAGPGRAGPAVQPVRAGGRPAADPVELHQRAQGAAGPGVALTAPRLLLILTENWTMRPAPDVADLVRFAVEAEQAGIDGVMVSEHIVLGPSAGEAGLPVNPRDYALPGNQDPAT